MPAKTFFRISQLCLILCLLASVTQPVNAQTSPDPKQALANAVAYLKAQQQPDGGMTGFSGVSDPDTTIRTLLALLLNNQPWESFTSSEGETLVDYLESQAAAYVYDPNQLLFPGRAGLLLTAVALSRQDVHSFGGLDLAAELAATFQPETGAYATAAALDYSSGAASDLNQAWAILGLSLAGQPIPTPATFYLASTQGEDGSWAGGDLDTTALVLTALFASRNVPSADGMVTHAIDFFKTSQLANGGWKPAWDQDPLNADTTGWVAQALASAGWAPLDRSWSTAEGDPISALLSLVKEDGSIGGTYVNAYSTADALIGLAQTSLVKFAQPLAFQRAALLVQNGDGSLFTACIAFPEQEISGLELLLRSGLEIATITDPSLGTAVCGIAAEGCPSSDCFCATSNYWSYWQPAVGAWAYAVSGAEQTVVKGGSIDAWSWGEGEPPVLLTFPQICQPGSVQPASLASMPLVESPSAYPEPEATPTTAVEAYPEPTDTTQPVVVPTELPPSPTTSLPATQVPSETGSPLVSALPYALFGLVAVGLLIAVLRVIRRKP